MFKGKKKGFSSIVCGQTIEQTCNRNSKTKGDIVGLTQNGSAINRWILAQADRSDTDKSAAARNCQLMAGIAEEQRFAHNDKTKSYYVRIP